MAARCRKFVPNLFNKSKCQSCFGSKESHTAEALESSKAARKISKCAYLFVSPDLDFSNPLQRTKRWQRRFFILYDDGELTYSVDDNPSTIPQGSVDMNKCTDVFDAEEKTGHEFSIGITVPGQPASYVKGTSKDEIRRWFDVLVMYPRSLTIKTKRIPGGKAESPPSTDSPEEITIDNINYMGAAVQRHLSYYPPTGTDKSLSDDEDADSVHSKDSSVEPYERSGRTRGRYRQKDLRRSKSEVRPSDLKLAEDEFNKKNDNQTKKDKVDGMPARRAGEPETFSSVRSMKHRKAAKSQGLPQANTSSDSKSGSSSDQPSTTTDPTVAGVTINQALGVNRRLSIPNMSTGAKPADHKSLTRTTSAAASKASDPASSTGGAVGGAFSAFVFPPSTTTTSTTGATLIDANETDEHKIMKNEHARKSMEKSPIVRKGWLLVRQDASSNVWSKHWFVLCGRSLSYYQDAKAEETNTLDGVIDVASAYEVSSIKAERNHGFRIKTKEGEYTLSAMTSGIRRNWVEAVEGIIAEIRRAKEKSAKQDMGFVFESPIRSPRTPAVVATAAPVLAPVVPDSSSRVNSALREMAERRRETGDDRPLDELYDVVPASAASASPLIDRKDSACSDTEREVSSLTSKQDAGIGAITSAGLPPLKNPVTVDVPAAPKSPSAFVSPSQRIKEKSRAKTPPRARSPPPPSPLPGSTSTGVALITSKPSTPVDRLLLLPTGSSSDENDESLNAKLLESQKQVQHLQQQVQDVNSMVRKQRVEIESLQTKLDLTTSQLHDMETALTHSAQNLNKERKNVNRLNEALEGIRRGQSSGGGDSQEKCARLERQLQDATHKLATQEVKMAMVSSLEEQLQIRTSKLATLEKVLGNTRRHLQDAVENVRETELTYQSKIEELEQEYEEERVELQDKIHEMEEKLDKFVTESNNSVNSELSGQLMKEKNQSMQRLEELVKEQKGKIDQLTEENSGSRQQIDELQCYKDRVLVIQNQLDSSQLEYGTMRNTIQTLGGSLESLKNNLKLKDDELITKCQENDSLLATIDELQTKCRLAQESQSSVSADSGNHDEEREQLRVELESVTTELNAALNSSHTEIEQLRKAHANQTKDLTECKAQVQSLTEKCTKLEVELRKEKMKSMMTPPPSGSQSTKTKSAGSKSGTPTPDGYTLAQIVEYIGAVARSTERMTESAVAMLAGEMIETDIKATINFNQEQRTAIGAKTVDQMVKNFAGIRQRLNYIVKNHVSKKMADDLHTENLALKETVGQLSSQSGDNLPVSQGIDDSAHIHNNNTSDYLSALLERCRAEILCISTDITRLDISHVESKLQNLNTTLEQLDKQKTADHFSADMTLVSYCNKLSVQAAAMFEMARTVSCGIDLSKVLFSVENCLNSTSGMATSIEDLSLRNFALLVSERLLISHELNHVISTGQWKGFSSNEQSDFTTKALVTETLQRIEACTLSQGHTIPETCLNSCINSLLQHNIAGRPSLELLKKETKLITQMSNNLNESMHDCVREYCLMFTTELVNFGSIEIREVDGLATTLTEALCRQIKNLAVSGQLSDLSKEWAYDQLCTVCNQVKGLDAKDLPADFMELALKLCMFEAKFNMSSTLITRRQTSTLSQSLLAEASKLAGLSSELAKKASVPDSTESKIAVLAQRLEQTDRLLGGYTGHYGDTVQQVMREVVNSLQMSVMKYHVGTGDYPASRNEQTLVQQVEQLKMQIQTANKHRQKHVEVDQHEKTIEELTDQMSVLRVEHTSELDESKRDMKMVLKSVKAEEHRLATELTEQISQLRNELSEEKRQHQIELMELNETRPDQVSAEDHAQLKDKVRDLENCLHEMQEEFEEELYQERRVHLAELDKARAELLEVVTRADNQQLTSDNVHEQYEAVIEKLKAEQASLQQWIDDIREAHRDEMDALQHERDTALGDEVMATQAALEAMKSAHNIEMEQEKSRLRELQEKTERLVQVDRDLLLQSRENENNEKRIAGLEAKVSTSTRKLAKLELNAKKNEVIIADLKSQNQKVVDRNAVLVDKFSQELNKLASSDKPATDSAQTMALKARLEALEEQLRLESLSNRQLEERMDVMKATYEQQLKQEEERSESRSSSASPNEDMVRRRLRARSPSPHGRRSSPPVFALSSSHSTGTRSGTSRGSLDSKSSSTSPKKQADRAYDLSRSKSTPVMDKQMTIVPRTKRLSSADEGPISQALNQQLPNHHPGLEKYRTSGGISLADRMRKFT